MRLVTDTRTVRKNTASSCGIGMARDWSGTTVRAVSRPFSFARCNDRSTRLQDWRNTNLRRSSIRPIGFAIQHRSTATLSSRPANYCCWSIDSSPSNENGRKLTRCVCARVYFALVRWMHAEESQSEWRTCVKIFLRNCKLVFQSWRTFGESIVKFSLL